MERRQVMFLIMLFAATSLLLMPAVEGAMSLPGWHIGDWGACNTTCGGGVQRRPVHCLDGYGQVSLIGLLCGPPPPEEELYRPCNTDPCDFFYLRLSPWSDCSAPCGVGSKQRQTECMMEKGQVASSESFCARLQPNTDLFSPCNTAPCPSTTKRWAVGAWGPCSANECGGLGNSSRPVKCFSADLQQELPLDDCEGPAPVASKLCQEPPCDPCSLCDPNGTAACSSDDAALDASGPCVCSEGWKGPHCSVPATCLSGVMDSEGSCCISGVLDASRSCCSSSSPPGDSSNSDDPPVTDAQGICCASSSLLDACGVCGGRAIAVDATGFCCPGPLDAAGYCCPDGKLDSCGVCHGVHDDPTQPCPTDPPECGNGICEQAEGPWRRGDGRCLEDCPLPVSDCPMGPSRVLPGEATSICSDAGRCLVGQGSCDCFRGYGGDACELCEGGWERTITSSGVSSGAGPSSPRTCVPMLPPKATAQSEASSASTATPTPTPTGDSESGSEGALIPMWGLVLIVAAAVIVALAVLLLLCRPCLRHHALEALELYPADMPVISKEAVMSQATVFTPGIPRRPYPGDPGWKPIELEGPPKRRQSIPISQAWSLVAYRTGSPNLTGPAPGAVVPRADGLPPRSGTAPAWSGGMVNAAEPLLPLLPPGAPLPLDLRPYSAQDSRGPFAIMAASTEPSGGSMNKDSSSSSALQVYQATRPGAGVFVERPGSRQRPSSSRDGRLSALTVRGPRSSAPVRSGSVPTTGSVGGHAGFPQPQFHERPGSVPTFSVGDPGFPQLQERPGSVPTGAYPRPSSGQNAQFGGQEASRPHQQQPGQVEGEAFSPMSWGTWGSVDPSIATITEETSYREIGENLDGGHQEEEEKGHRQREEEAAAMGFVPATSRFGNGPFEGASQMQQQKPASARTASPARPKSDKRRTAFTVAFNEAEGGRPQSSSSRGEGTRSGTSMRELLGIGSPTRAAKSSLEMAPLSSSGGSGKSVMNLLLPFGNSNSGRNLASAREPRAGKGTKTETGMLSSLGLRQSGRNQQTTVAELIMNNSMEYGSSGAESMSNSLDCLPLPSVFGLTAPQQTEQQRSPGTIENSTSDLAAASPDYWFGGSAVNDDSEAPEPSPS